MERIAGTPVRRCREDVARYSLNEKKMKNFECYEQAILIALLNQFCSIKLQKPFKQSVSITSKPEVVTIVLNNEEIAVKKIAETQCKKYAQITEVNTITDKTRMRRFAKNRSTFTINFMYDIAFSLGFFFNSVLSKKSSKCLQIERIHEVFYNNVLLLGAEDIVACGEALNDYLFSLVKQNKDVVLNQNDPVIQKFINEDKDCLYPVVFA
ncbi:hypothetical protein EIN_060510 [Entamoeba invadens IP1]|uniref:hypothetical protein n=1 Tax=Entamoeba invadens IP1 TaxID=370355 RepID=UPI0002C3E44E|nr:hypothetical protein EIN_060510 [Entamoeba invadens IP1]ELP93516.1 hypothetical protein EIN_060510 [Entamoeba invadens IP1]|eukprot:XP_004260287.1 hypothetical protein EIN_060510 [Entamoeba invadens IP1]